MDSYREHPSDFDPVFEAADSDTPAPPLEIGTDERRMHVRAYNYWASLLDGRDYPSIEDLEPADLVDFAPHSLLLDFTAGRDNPALPYIGAALREECDLAEDVRAINDVPKRSLLSRLTDHYMQIIANRAPVGFEAEFMNQRGEELCYRGILMPFSSDGDTIDFIYGVINWKKVERDAAAAIAPVLTPVEPETDEEPLELTDIVPGEPETGFAEEEETEAPSIELDADAGLADRLWAARETAEAAKAAEGRSRGALYQALSYAYDFALASLDAPEDYAELLEDSGVKAQARAPMTPIVKLVFGIDHDKARLTEYAAALSHAERHGIGLGGFLDFIEGHAGGLKGLVAAERLARRPQAKPDTKTDKARAQLRGAAPVELDTIQSEEEFALVLTRRAEDGRHEAIAVVNDPGMLERAIRRAASC